MAGQFKNSYKVYTAWNYEKEIEDLNKASEEGWQLVKGGCFHSRFQKNTDVQYRYQLDYRKLDDPARYISTFREQGWEYINSTFNGWHYFRKLYDPSLPEEEYEIFTDQESVREMNGRWLRIATGLGIALALVAVLYAIRMIIKPQLPMLILLLMIALESFFLLRGAMLMRDQKNRNRKNGESGLFFAFIASLIIGIVSSLILTSQRPYLQMQSQSESITEPIINQEFCTFEIKYPDRYYIDLEIDAKAPFTFTIQDEQGSTVYSVTESALEEKDIPLKLSRGKYLCIISCEDGYLVKTSID